MRTRIIPILLLFHTLSAACPRTEQAASPPATSAEPSQDALVLVEAKLALRLLNAKIEPTEFCEHHIPYLELSSRSLVAQCSQRSQRIKVLSEAQREGRRSVTLEGERTLTLEPRGRERYWVEGDPCGGGPGFFVVYPEVRSYRDEWLKAASCPTEDMKVSP